MIVTALLSLSLALAAGTRVDPRVESPLVEPLIDGYVERYFATYPTAATAAGQHDFDERLEDLGPEARAEWLAFNRQTATTLRQRLAYPGLDADARIDAEVVLAQAEREIFAYETLRRPQRDPLFWTDFIANATIFLLLRDDLPAMERWRRAEARTRLLPRLATTARTALAAAEVEQIAPEICAIAAAQVADAATFYRHGLAAATTDATMKAHLTSAGQQAAQALDELASFFEALADRASGSPRLASHYAALLQRTTGFEASPETLLAQASLDLDAKRTEVAAFGRGVWPQIFPGTATPVWDGEVIRRLFAHLAEDRASSIDAFVDDFRDLVQQASAFVEEHEIVDLPASFRVRVETSPSYFVGQSVGGVFPPGPYAADATTLLFVPTPPADLPPPAMQAFFRDFNHSFNVMITPHETVPGHALQMTLAARHPQKVRALFADGVYVEGWGTFSERLMLDLGWGSISARLAHLKKQLENIARTVVDIRIHTRGMARDEVLRFVTEEAHQDEQFAANMWHRAITHPTQLTTYYLGYREIWNLYREVRRQRGESFVLKPFVEAMLATGPIPLRNHRRHLLN